jgi:hypothetical protein
MNYLIFSIKCIISTNFLQFFLIPKISGPFWRMLALKYVLIDIWANDQNEMMFFYFQP